MPPKPSLPVAVSRESIAAKIRQTIADRRLSSGIIAAAAGIDRRTVERFLSGQRDIYLASVDRICLAIGLKLTDAAPRKQPRPGKPLPDLTPQLAFPEPAEPVSESR